MLFQRDPRAGAVAAVFLLALSLSSCGRSERSITESRDLPERERKVALDATSDQRFGANRPTPGMAGPGASSGPPGNPFRWEVPQGWEEVPATSMRVANFSFGGGEGECYLSALPGNAGGASANINRWRSQMGLEPWGDDEIAALPTVSLLSQQAPFATLDGTFTGMGSAPKENFRMLGAILSYDQFTLFVKMTGPVDVVKKEEQNFKIFCGSLNIVTPGQ